MASIFSNPTIQRRYVPKVTKHEETLQKQVCSYIRLQHPNVIFRSDYASGLHLTAHQARTHASLQSAKGFPDLTLLHPTTHKKQDGTVVHYCGMFLELKKEGTIVILKTGSRKGMLSTNPHIQEQAIMMRSLIKRGYYANFGVGYDDCIKKIDWYLSGVTTENTSLF